MTIKWTRNKLGVKSGFVIQFKYKFAWWKWPRDIRNNRIPLKWMLTGRKAWK